MGAKMSKRQLKAERAKETQRLTRELDEIEKVWEGGSARMEKSLARMRASRLGPDVVLDVSAQRNLAPSPKFLEKKKAGGDGETPAKRAKEG